MQETIKAPDCVTITEGPAAAPAVPAVYAAIHEVQTGLAATGISKDRRCQGGASFAYRGIEDVYAALAPLLAKARLVIYPGRIDQCDPAVAGKMRLERALVTYRVQSTLDGSYIDMQSLGEGADTSDKASGKLMSYAYKNLIFTAFAVPVEGMADPDREVLEPAAPFLAEKLRAESRAAAEKGMSAYKAYWASIPAADRKAINAAGLHSENKGIAAAADKATADMEEQ